MVKNKFDLYWLMLLLGYSLSVGQEKHVALKVIVPPATPKDAIIYIAGNHPVLGDWDPGKVKLQKENDSVWTTHFNPPKGAVVEFKITRGSWNTQAMYQQGSIPQNTRLLVNEDTVVVLRPVTWSDLSAKSKQGIAGGGVTGTVRYHHGLKGEGLAHERDVIVWLPPSYSNDETKRYPVLYMHDGQNIFDPTTSYIGYDWHADEVADSLIRVGKIQEIIIVGIDNTADRMREYSDSDLGKRYADFIVQQVKPMIDKTYRTKPDRENTAVMGSSMGGVISFMLVWWYPDVFSQAGCLSNAFWVDDDKVLKDVRAYKGSKKSVRIYLDVGGLEGGMKQGYDEMVKLLKDKGYNEGKDLEYFFDKDAEHNEYAWAHRLWRPLTFMFGK
ncbi:MAG: histidine kinase [Ignavibacteriales bacterium]|nr:histidine kinase [Ignavibacteriales bacterium]